MILRFGRCRLFAISMIRFILLTFIAANLASQVIAQDILDFEKMEPLEKAISQQPNVPDWYLFVRCSSHITVLSGLGQIDESRREEYRSVGFKFLLQSVKIYMKEQGLSLDNRDLIDSVVDKFSRIGRSLDKLYIQDLSSAQARYAEDALAHSMLGSDSDFCSGLVLALD